MRVNARRALPLPACHCACVCLQKSPYVQDLMHVKPISPRMRTSACVRSLHARCLYFGWPDDNVVLQFGRVGKDLFTMDFAHPLSPLQGMPATAPALRLPCARPVWAIARLLVCDLFAHCGACPRGSPSTTMLLPYLAPAAFAICLSSYDYKL